ncbi:MAG: Cof-type HAD-IIB family hydrolase [Spirulinaceae cyanobacterium]
MNIRLLILDIDGTIAGESNQVRDAVIKAVEKVQKEGIMVALATGRMYCSALRFYKTIGSKLPLIAYNGAWIQNPQTGKLLRHLPLPSEVAEELLDYLEQQKFASLLGIHFYIQDKLYVQEITQRTKNYAARSGVQPTQVEDLHQVISSLPTKVLTLSDDVEKIKQLTQSLQEHYENSKVYITQSTPTFVEATSMTANKGNAVRYLTEEVLGLKAENVMAIGDNFNDWEMLKYAQIGVAMGDGPEEVQKLAQWVAPGVEEDGVVAAIEKFLL